MHKKKRSNALRKIHVEISCEFTGLVTPLDVTNCVKWCNRKVSSNDFKRFINRGYNRRPYNKVGDNLWERHFIDFLQEYHHAFMSEQNQTFVDTTLPFVFKHLLARQAES